MFACSDSMPCHVAFDKLLGTLLLWSHPSKWICIKTAALYLRIQWTYIDNVINHCSWHPQNFPPSKRESRYHYWPFVSSIQLLEITFLWVPDSPAKQTPQQDPFAYVYWKSLIAEAKRPQAQNWCCLYRPRKGMTHTWIGCAWVMLITSFACLHLIG